MSKSVSVWTVDATPLAAKTVPATPTDPPTVLPATYPATHHCPWLGFASAISNWRLERRLLPQENTVGRRGRGRATFQVLQPRIKLPDGTIQTYTTELKERQWVAICHGPVKTEPNEEEERVPVFDPAQIKWIGWLSDIDLEQIPNSLHGPGFATALGIGDLWDEITIDGWNWRAIGDNEYGTPINRPPTANIQTADGQIIGNVVRGQDDNLPKGLELQYVFARRTSDHGTANDNYMTRWRLLRHILAYCRPEAFPAIQLSISNGQNDEAIDQAADCNPEPEPEGGEGGGEGGEGGEEEATPTHGPIQCLLDDLTAIEVFDLRNLQLSTALDLTIPESLGLSFNVSIVQTEKDLEWKLTIFPISATAYTTSHPEAKAAPIGIPESVVERLRYRIAKSAIGTVDKLILRGAPYLFANTYSNADANIQAGYSADQLTTWGAEGETLTDDEIKARRAQPDLNDVGRRFILQNSLGDDLPTQVEPVTGDADLDNIDGYSENVIPAIPQVRRFPGSDGKLGGEANTFAPGSSSPYAGLFVSDLISRAPYVPAARIQKTLPWPKGLAIDGTDQRSAEQLAQPEYMDPVLLIYDEEAAEPWVDLFGEDRTETPRLALPHGSLAFELRFSAQQQLLRLDLDTVNWIGLLDPDPGEVLAWQNLVITLAIESDQYLEAVRERHSDAQVLTTKIIERPEFAVWIIRRGTIMGLDNDGTPLRAPKDLVVRDDSATVDRLADLLSQWFFKERNQVTIRHLDPTLEANWAEPCKVISQINDATIVPVNAAVASVRRIYSGTPALIVTTDTPSVPVHLLTPGTGAGSGGRNNVPLFALGAPAGHATARQAQAIRIDERDNRQRVVREGRSAASGQSPLKFLEILGGNISNPGNIASIKKVSSVITSSATKRDPGTRATAGTITISSGVITAVAVSNPGTGYEDGNRVCDVTGDGTGAAVTATVSGGVVTGFTISNGGTGYTTATIIIRPPNGDAPGIPWAEDGLGYGNLIDPQDPNNYTRVLIVNDNRSPLDDAITQKTNRSTPIRGTATIDHDDAATTSTVYIPWAV